MHMYIDLFENDGGFVEGREGGDRREPKLCLFSFISAFV